MDRSLSLGKKLFIIMVGGSIILATLLSILTASALIMGRDQALETVTEGLENQGQTDLELLIHRDATLSAERIASAASTGLINAQVIRSAIETNVIGESDINRYRLAAQSDGNLIDTHPDQVTSIFAPAGANRAAVLADLRHSAVLEPLLPAQDQMARDIVSFTFVGPSGVVRMYPRTSDVAAELGRAQLFLELYKNNERGQSWLPPFKSPRSSGLIWTVLTPIYHEQTFSGVVAIDIVLSQVNFDIAENLPTPGSYSFLIDSQRSLITAPPESLPLLTGLPQSQQSISLLEAPYILTRAGTPELDDAIGRMVKGESRIERLENSGHPYFLAYAPIEGTRWRLGMLTPINELTAQAARSSEVIVRTSRNALLTTILIALVFVILLAAASQLLSRRITRPLVNLAQAAQAVGGGDYSQQLEVKTHDEIGQVSTAFNTMIQSVLRAHAELATHNQQLEEMVQARTAALAEALQVVEQRELHLAETNEQLSQAKDAAEEANVLKSRFMANMSHELRTPLNSIINFTRIMMAGMIGPVNEEQIDFLNRVRHSGEHLLGLINDILDLSKIEAGRMELYPEHVELEPLIQSVMATAAGLIKENHLSLDLVMPAQLPAVLIDKGRIRQVMLNLLSNAAKFTKEGGITVRVSQRGRSEISIAIQDTGIGIAPEYLPKVFEEFRQVDNDLTREYAGTGLGLPISRRLVELHGGTMSVESTPGAGSTFTFTLPISQAPGASAIPAQPAEALDLAGAPDGEPLDVLIIDDDPDSQRILRMMLTNQGYRVQGLLDSTQAMSAVHELRPRLVLLDVQMPQVNGWEVLAQIKSTPEIASVPVVMCSVVEPGAVGVVLGAQGHIVKPVREEALLEVVSAIAAASATALVIDDNADAREIMRQLLAAAGYTVFEARDGLEGLALVEQERPDFVILDLMMPNMDGFEFLEELRSTRNHYDLPVIVVSAKDLEPHEHAWLLHHTQSYIAKSQLSESGFIQHIQQILQQTLI